jgi:YD repeat-containing protein
VTAGARKRADGSAIAGMQFGYAFDTIGNRTSATTNGRQAVYDANLLNQYEEATVPGALDVLGTANPQATLLIAAADAAGRSEATVQPAADGWFHTALTVANSTAPRWLELSVTAALPGAGPDGKDLYAQSTGQRFLPQTPESFTYDADGNLTADGRWSYAWEAENRLIGMETLAGTPAAARRKLAFAYDAQSRRIAKTVYAWDAQAQDWTATADTLFVYDGWNLIAEIDGTSGDPIRAYAWGLVRHSGQALQMAIEPVD